MGYEPGNIEKYLPTAREYGWSDEASRGHIAALITILQTFADEAWNLDPTALALRSDMSKSFLQAAGHDSFSATRRMTRDDLDNEGATNTQILKEVSGDDRQRPSQGDHLHPRI